MSQPSSYAATNDAIMDMQDEFPATGQQPAAGPADLEFQNFHLSNTPSASKSAKYGTGKSGDWSDTVALTSAEADRPILESDEPQAAGQSHAFYTVEYYQRFFDIDTPQLLHRIGMALLPYKNNFLDSISPNADLYGPFWITTTVVFVLFVAGNLAKSVVAYESGATFEPDFTQLSVAAMVVYLYAFLVPLLLWLALRYYRVPLNLLELTSLYGYGLAIFVPISIICVAPYDWVKWLFSMLAFAHSSLFLSINMWPVLKAGEKRIALLVLTAVILLHMGLALTFKFVFFTYSPISLPTAAP